VNAAAAHASDQFDRWSWTEWLLLSQAALLAALNSFRGLQRSLWLDETLTFWATDASIVELIRRAVHHQGQTPFFFLTVWPAVRLFGTNEIALRAPAILAFVLSTFVIYRIGRSLVGRETGLFAAYLFNGLWAAHLGSPEARPYSLAVLCLLVATLALINWRRERRTRDLWWYVVSMLGAVYAHVLFAPALALHLAFVIAAGDVRKRVGALFLPLLVLGLGLVPTVALASILGGKWALYSFAPMPSVSDLAFAWFFIVLLCLLWLLWLPAALLVLRRVPGRIAWQGRIVDGVEWALLWGWSLWPALCLYLLSHLRGESVFVPRYYAWQVPGIALLTAVVIAKLASREGRRLLYVAYVIPLLGLTIVRTGEAGPNWREAVGFLNEAERGNGVPILFWSGLVETRSLEWFGDPANVAYMTAPLSVYPLEGQVVPVPHPESVSRLEDFMSAARAAELRSQRIVWVIAYNPSGADEIARWVERDGSRRDSPTHFGQITVIRIDRRTEQPTDSEVPVVQERIGSSPDSDAIHE
jgi:hypothetical protein